MSASWRFYTSIIINDLLYNRILWLQGLCLLHYSKLDSKKSSSSIKMFFMYPFSCVKWICFSQASLRFFPEWRRRVLLARPPVHPRAPPTRRRTWSHGWALPVGWKLDTRSRTYHPLTILAWAMSVRERNDNRRLIDWIMLLFHYKKYICQVHS